MSVLHTGAVVGPADEARYLAERPGNRPYGVVLWPAAIALAQEIAARAADFRGRAVLELGAGTGLPGVVAAAAGAIVVQTDRQELALHLCRVNGERNRCGGIEYLQADWAAWGDDRRYDWVLGADILYADANHPHLRRVFDAALAPGGRLLLADPFRVDGLRLLEGLEADGWRVTMSRWAVGEGDGGRAVAVYEAAPPGQ